MSARAELAERIAEFVRKHELDNPFGGDVQRLDGDRYYSILCSIPYTLDGIIKVYGPKFIQIKLRGQAVGGNDSAVFESEAHALDYLKALLVDFDRDAADAIPQKKEERKI